MNPEVLYDVLLFAEDPGAANFISQLPAALAASGLTSVFLATGLATSLLETRGIPYEKVEFRETANTVIDRYKPRAIVTGTAENLDTFAFALNDEGNRLGIPTFGAVDMAVNADRRFRGQSSTPFTHAPTCLMVPDYFTRQAFERLGFAGDIAVVGYPQRDNVRAAAEQFAADDLTVIKKRIFPFVVSKKPIVTFVAEPASTISPLLSTYNCSYLFRGRGNTKFRTLIILEELLDAMNAIALDAHLVVRLHPKSKLEDFNSYKHEIDYLSSGGDPLELLWCSDLVVGITSMLLQESTWLGKKSVAILAEPEDRHRLASIASGLTESVNSREMLIQMLREFQQSFTLSATPLYKAQSVPDTSESAANRMTAVIAKLAIKRVQNSSTIA